MRLLPGQAWALREAAFLGGLAGFLPCGSGKTAVGLLAPIAVPACQVAALLVPPGLVGQLEAEHAAWSEHWRTPTLRSAGRDLPGSESGGPLVHVVPYSALSSPRASRLLDELGADLVVADECHHLRRRESTRTARFLRGFLDRPGTRLLCWSGTLAGRSLRDFAHLLALALGEGSPLPLEPGEVDRWAAAVDPSDWPAPAGELGRLAGGSSDVGRVREALRARVLETRGVVSSPGAAGCAAPLVLREAAAPPPPPAVREALAQVRRTWTRPDGEELVEAAAVARVLRELACGFHYKWTWPGDPNPALVEAWFEARRAWGRELRARLARPLPGLDSPHLCALAAERAERGERGTQEAPAWPSRFWAAWRDVRGLVRHETEPVWADRWLARWAASWALESARAGAPGVVWYASRALGEAVAAASGLRAFQGGDADELRAEAALGERSLLVSQRAHGTGLDGLQARYSRALLLEPPPGGEAFEQLACRLWRRGQAADEVVLEVCRHTPELRRAHDRAAAQARYARDVAGARQAVLVADVEWELPPEAASAADELGLPRAT